MSQEVPDATAGESWDELRPIKTTNEQRLALAKSFGCCRWYWNYSLNLCQETYQSTGKGLSRSAIQGLLPGLKKEHPELLSNLLYEEELSSVLVSS